ncbi:T-complex protein 1 subunit theta [Tieghemiomyces parasiticus]|uniref:CCT-theta n=1 Tax=Tieghemiomyces parasiticus TaxID=78921 RepID=A0A9W8E0L5_9FUNG|nr:T-complex protein 1 subunit theta [Tieghemiomyces parasiticus]
MALRLPKAMLPQLFKDGYKNLQGVEEAVIRNITAVKQMSEMTRTSLGPNGRNKMVINHLERLFVTNDAATIIRELEVEHPAARLLVMSSQQQEQEIGDGTNLVVIFAGELLQKAEYLLRMGLHPSEVVQGYELAAAKAQTILEELVVDQVASIHDAAELTKAVRTAIAAKQYGHEDLLTGLVTEAVGHIMPKNPAQFSVDAVRVVKVMGGSLYDSRVLRGMVFARSPESVVKKVTKAKVAIFTCSLDISQTETKGTVLIQNAKEMLDFSKGEETVIETQVRELADAGVKVVVTGSAVGDLVLHFLNRYGILVLRVPSKFDLRRLCRVTGATALARLGAPTPEEMGFCDVVEAVEIGGDRVTVFRQETEATKTVTIVVRGATQNHLDDIERAIDDGVNVIKAITKDTRLLAGAGAVEMELSKRLLSYGEKTPGLNQHAIKKFAEALEVIPRTLADNAGLDSSETIAKLYSAHYRTDAGTAGVDVEGTSDIGVIDAVEKQIFDVLAVKQWGLRYASSAALTILKVDQIIMSKPAGGPKPPKNNANWDED